MSRPPSPTGPGGIPIPVPDEPDEPMAADKRTMLIALVVMFALVLVGVASAAVFTTSACDAIDPEPIDDRIAGADVDEVLTDAFGDELDATQLEAMATTLQELTGDLGPLTGLAEVTGADALTSGAAGVVATGATTTALGPDGGSAIATVEFDDARLVGSGEALYALSIGNDLTGQVDALLPLDGQLVAQTCVDTATIGTPLAFELDAEGGELLLFRVDEDGDDPEAELRDPVAGSRWSSPLQVGVAQPGVLGQRLTGRLGPDTAVVGYRTTPESDTPVVAAVDRTDGEPRWTVERSDLADVLSPDAPQTVDVVAAGGELVLLVLGPDEGDGTAGQAPGADPDGDPAVLVGLSADDGSMRWRAALGEGDVLHDVVQSAERATSVVTGSDGTGITLADGEGVERGPVAGDATPGRVAVRDDDRTVLVTAQAIHTGADGGSVPLPDGVVGADVLADGDEVTVLFAVAEDGDGAVAVTFGG